ncbi:SpoVR family protein [Thalassotalea sp. LPB0316]|uniref:SpoVR family protein n=1 Tax=Thalassotalea sp. LPB0316 TaxID=2769490 RepID=UPI0018683A4A|nr:SpoVR family protein [Thalassotalea sp. LPB0316]QOL27124.1 SpoVR family protein [Thalassotalea sp. LPB0316]
MAKQIPLDDGPDWTFPLLKIYQDEIERVAKHYQLSTYPNQIEVITAEQMMDAYASIGMPIGYNHWTFGKKFIETQQTYKRGFMGLAYEIVINSDPCIAYLMEENSMTMQALVMAHACYGHNSFFKNNYLFKSWTDASSIIDYLLFAKSYVAKCEQKYGIDDVETCLDACHALMNHGVDRYKRPQKLSLDEELKQQEARAEYLQSQVNLLWRTLPEQQKSKVKKADKFPREPQENILYFIEKNAPLLAPWQRELVRIVRKISQYFYPQKQTQVMNEGWACFWHYTILNHLYDEGKLTDKFMMEFLHNHTNVVAQPSYNSKFYSGINPYALGFNMFMDIKRICQEPTDEDKHWFPDIAGSDWLKTLHFAMENFKDESFILQYLSPKLMRDMKLFNIHDDQQNSYVEISAIHNEAGYKEIRSKLSQQYNLSILESNIQITEADINGDRSLTLCYIPQNEVPLASGHQEVLKHLHYLWKFDVKLVEDNGDDEPQLLSQWPEKETKKAS